MMGAVTAVSDLRTNHMEPVTGGLAAILRLKASPCQFQRPRRIWIVLARSIGVCDPGTVRVHWLSDGREINLFRARAVPPLPDDEESRV